MRKQGGFQRIEACSGSIMFERVFHPHVMAVEISIDLGPHWNGKNKLCIPKLLMHGPFELLAYGGNTPNFKIRANAS